MSVTIEFINYYSSHAEIPAKSKFEIKHKVKAFPLGSLVIKNKI